MQAMPRTAALSVIQITHGTALRVLKLSALLMIRVSEFKTAAGHVSVILKGTAAAALTAISGTAKSVKRFTNAVMKAVLRA